MTTPVPIEVSNRQISEALSPFGISPSVDQMKSIREYLLLLLKWNQSISLTSVTDPVEILGRHFGESMYAMSVLPVENCRLADVGSGAGFPGLALKVVCPGIRLLLIESNKKKCAFLAEIVRSLGLTAVEVLSDRFEDVRPETALADVITARAVGGFPQLLRWSRNALAHRGHLALWVGAEDSTRITKIGGWIWNPAVRIPGSQRRFILTGRRADEPSSRR